MITTRLDPYSALLPFRFRNKIAQAEQTIQKEVNVFYRKHRLAHRVAYAAMHVFRMAAMVGMASVLPWNLAVNCTVCVVGVAVYRFTAEPPCTMRYAVSSLEGQMAFVALAWGVKRVSERAFSGFYLTGLAFIPMAFWAVGVIKLAANLEPPSCCSK